MFELIYAFISCVWEFSFPLHFWQYLALVKLFKFCKSHEWKMVIVVLIYWWYFIFDIYQGSMKCGLCPQHTKFLSLGSCIIPSTSVLTWVSEADTEGWEGQEPGCGTCVMLQGWWLPLYPHPVSLKDCKAITDIDPNFLKCRLLSVYWLGTFWSYLSWWACGIENASSQRSLAENILLLMSFKNLCQVDMVTK